MYKTVILPLAKQDIGEAAKWYNDRQPGLGKRFTTHLRRAIFFISQNPQAVALRYDDIRTVLLETFPYMIHFSIDEKHKTIVIAAVFNTSRDPKIWHERK